MFKRQEHKNYGKLSTVHRQTKGKIMAASSFGEGKEAALESDPLNPESAPPCCMLILCLSLDKADHQDHVSLTLRAFVLWLKDPLSTQTRTTAFGSTSSGLVSSLVTASERAQCSQ